MPTSGSTKAHGGKRSGAGRKPFDEKPVRVTVTLLPSTIKALHKIDTNLSAAIRTLARQSHD
jgi:hypothetical protein